MEDKKKQLLESSTLCFVSKSNSQVITTIKKNNEKYPKNQNTL